MADGQEDAAGLDEDLVLEDELRGREEGEDGGGGGGEEEEEDDVDGLASFLESEILSGSSSDDPTGVSCSRSISRVIGLCESGCDLGVIGCSGRKGMRRRSS